MSNDRGVFTLGAYRRAQVEGQGVDLNDVWFPPTTTGGYFAGGLGPGSPTYVGTPIPGSLGSTIVSKLTFGSGTLARIPSGDLPDENVASGPFSSNSAGYMVGGSNSGNGRNSTVRKLTYSTDTTASIGDLGALSDGWIGAATFNSLTAGYATAGNAGPHSNQHPVGGTNYATKMTFGSDSWNAIPNLGLPVGRTGQALSSSTSGYVLGGRTDSGSVPTYGYLKSFVSKFSFSSDTNSRTPSSDLSIPIKNVSATGDSSSGYIMGGGTDDVNYTSVTSRIQKFSYTTETTSLNPSNIPVAMLSSSATGDKSNGYSAGGVDGSSNYYSSITKIDFSTGTTSSFGSDLPQGARSSIGAFSPIQGNIPEVPVRWTDGWTGTYDGGYWAGGRSTTPGGWPAPGNEYRSSIFKVNFATDVGEISPSKLTKTMGGFQYVVADDVNGYLIGGDPSPDQEVMRFNMVSDTASTLPNASPSARIRSNNDMGITYGKLYGYGQGGINENLSPDEGVSSTAKFTFATETSGEAPSANWSGSPAPRIFVSSVGNLTSHGYFTGGMTFKQSQPEYGKSDIAKMTYSTETISEIPANLNGSFFYSATMSSETAGYITSHQYLPSWGANQQMNKITFATDTQSLLGGASSPERSQANGTGNASAGYVGGGYRSSPASSFMTNVYKLDYATETAMTLISSNWQGDSGTRGLYRGAAFGPLSAGRAAVGAPTPTPTSGYDPGNYELAAGIPNHGYYMGGNPASSMGNTNSMKMSFATDTLSTGVQLSEKYSTGGYGGGKMASSPSHAYAVYGRNPNGPGGETGNTYVRKVQYSNDTGSSAPTATNEPSYAGFVAGTTTKLYYAGGTDNSNVPLGTRTNIRKLTYSNDSWATTPQSSANYSNPSGWPRNGSTSGGTPEYMLMGPSISANDYKTTIAKFTYATDTGIMSIPGVNGDNSQAYAVGNSNDTHWYIARGNTMPGYGKQTNIGKFTFATNTYESAALVDTTNDYNGQNGTGAVNNGMIAGYWAGTHYDQQDATSTLKVTYSTDTVTRGPNIPSGRYSPASGNGGGNAFSGTTVQEWGNGGTRVPNVV